MDTSPLYDVIESVLREENLHFERIRTYRGFDVRVSNCYGIKLPATETKAKGIRRLFGRKDLVPKKTLKYITDKINNRYFNRFEPEILKNRPDLANPSILTDKIAHYIVASPEDKKTDRDFLDVARIEVIGYDLQ